MATEFYRYSYREAQAQDLVGIYNASKDENRRCIGYMEDDKTGLYANAYKDYVVDGDRAYTKALIKEFGMERVMFIIANTLKCNTNDPRITAKNREWADRTCASFFGDNQRSFQLGKIHIGVVDILANNVQEEYKALKLFDKSHCMEGDLGKLEGKVIVITPRRLKEKYWSPENQLWLAKGGFGCYPDKIGRAIYATCLFDGDEARWNREDVIGVIKEEFMPSWAKEKLSKLEHENVAAKTEDVELKL